MAKTLFSGLGEKKNLILFCYKYKLQIMQNMLAMVAKMPGVARGKKKIRDFFLAYITPRPPMSVQKNVSPIGPAVWPAIGNIFIYDCLVLLYEDKQRCNRTRQVLNMSKLKYKNVCR